MARGFTKPQITSARKSETHCLDTQRCKTTPQTRTINKVLVRNNRLIRAGDAVISNLIAIHHPSTVLSRCVGSHLPLSLSESLNHRLAVVPQTGSDHKNFPAGINKRSHYSDINYVTRRSFPQGAGSLTGPAE